MYKVGTKEFDENSETNQKIKALFVSREIKANVTDMVECILEMNEDESVPFSAEDILGGHRSECPDCGAKDTFETYTPMDIEVEIEADLLVDPVERFVCPVCGCRHSTVGDARKCCEGTSIVVCKNCRCAMTEEELGEMESENGAAEWYIVSEWLCGKLFDLGEIVILEQNLWGRSTIGADVTDDDCISQVCYQVGVLEGQDYQWRIA